MFIEELVGLEAVVELTEELVEQVSLGLVVPVSGGAAGIEVAAGEGEDPSAQMGPTAARCRFLMWRCSTTVFLPLARVIGAAPRRPSARGRRRNACSHPRSRRAPGHR